MIYTGQKYQVSPLKIEQCCPDASLDIRNAFESMDYLDSVQSRVNLYFCYRYKLDMEKLKSS